MTKNTEDPYLGSIKSFKVIDVDISEKLVAGDVLISSMSEPIYNRFHTRQANSGKITTFKGYPYLTSAYTGLLELRGSRLKLLISAFSGENFIRRLPWSIFSYFGAIFTLKMCVAARNREKVIKTP